MNFIFITFLLIISSSGFAKDCSIIGFSKDGKVLLNYHEVDEAKDLLQFRVVDLESDKILEIIPRSEREVAPRELMSKWKIQATKEPLLPSYFPSKIGKAEYHLRVNFNSPKREVVLTRTSPKKRLHKVIGTASESLASFEIYKSPYEPRIAFLAKNQADCQIIGGHLNAGEWKKN